MIVYNQSNQKITYDSQPTTPNPKHK